MVGQAGIFGEDLKITLNKLEALLAEESDKLDELRVFGSVSPNVYALLYLLARSGQIDLVDALLMSRHCDKLMSFMTTRVLIPDDLEAASSVLNYFCSDEHWSLVSYPSLAVLLNWCTRTLENKWSL